MTKLEEALKEFQGAQGKELTGKFAELAPMFLYGGYYSVRDFEGKEWYQIYIRTVEFYFHAEKDSDFKEKDPIVYHRDNRYVEGKVPYFSLMSLHAHASGFDITFENQEKQYRASALIRAYEVYDVSNSEQKQFLIYDTKKKKFIPWQNEKQQFNTQSTYLYNFLNGFDSDNIKWKEVDETQYKTNKFEPNKRQNVFKSKKDEVYEKDGNNKDERQWSFTRQEEVIVK